VTVLGYRSTTGRRPFEHRAHVVEGVSCTRCHGSTAEAGDDSPVSMPETALCLACHEQPHDPNRCRDCHGAEETDRRAEEARRYLAFAHRSHVRELDGGCVPCHAGAGGRLTPSMAACLGCHEHSKDFELAACDRCHANLETEDVTPSTHVVHRVGFAEGHAAQARAQGDLCRACHAEVECASCHAIDVPALEGRLELVRPKLDGIHRAGFGARHALEARADPGLCATCHDPETCRRCHERSDIATGSSFRSPHPPGWVGLTSNLHGRAAQTDPLACATCHGGAGEALCVSCHAVGGIGGSPHPAGFESRKGASADLPCRLCHVGSR
jgi:predicted CXXCH cytochrome family protein